GRYWWSRVVTNQDNGQVITIDSPGLTAEQRATLPQCGSYGGASQPVATFHTHVTGAAGQLYPSGYIAGAIAPNDLNNAAQRPDLQFFLKTHGMTPGTTSTFRYQAEPLPDGSGNIVWTAYYNTFKWINGQWQLFSYPQ
ncbi:MAG: hypothetical protein ACRD2A_07580, partial [Vicinamibacterales bacterium]